MMKKLIIGVVLGWMACIGTANAGLLLYTGTAVSGIQGLNIGGTLYDVDFQVAQGDATVWSTGGDAQAATDAIIALLNAAVPQPGFVYGDNTAASIFNVVFVNPLNSLDVDAYVATSSSGNAAWSRFGPLANPFSGFLFASFTAAVPLPPAVALLMVGLLGLGLSRRRTTA